MQYLEWYISVSKGAATVETVLVYYHTSSVLCGKNLTTPIAGVWLPNRSTSGSIKRKR